MTRRASPNSQVFTLVFLITLTHNPLVWLHSSRPCFETPGKASPWLLVNASHHPFFSPSTLPPIQWSDHITCSWRTSYTLMHWLLPHIDPYCTIKEVRTSFECLVNAYHRKGRSKIQYSFFFFLILNTKIFNILLNWHFLVLPFVCFLHKLLSREKRNESINLWVMS